MGKESTPEPASPEVGSDPGKKKPQMSEAHREPASLVVGVERKPRPQMPEPHPKVEVEEIGPCKKKLVIEVEAKDVALAIEVSIGELQKQAMLPGFRKGHAPVMLVEKRFGTDIRKEVKSNLVVQNYQKALEEKKIEPISDPDIDLDAIEMSEDKPLKYELTVEVWPEFEVTGYEGMKLEKPSAKPSEAEVDAEIQTLRMRTTTFEEVKDEAAAGTDFVICDYTVKAGDKEVASGKDAGVRPDDGVVGRLKIEKAKEALTGKKAGENVNLEFKISDDYYQEEFRGKKAELTLNVKGVRRPHTPEATDAWAKELGFESLEELKTVVGRNVEAAKESQADGALRGQIYEKLLEMLKFDLPEDAVRRQQKTVMSRERMGLQYRGATEEDLAKISDKLEEASLDRAQRDLKVFFILSKIAEKEGIQASEADVEMRTAEMASRYRTTVAKMREHLKREGMAEQLALEIREEKTVAHILSKAEITQAAPAAEEKKEEGEKKEENEKKEEAKEAKAKPKKPRVKKAAGKEEDSSGAKDSE